MTQTDNEKLIMAIRDSVNKTADKLGMPIDEGIKDTVVGIQAHGLATVGSCEGHARKPIAIPYVHLQTPEPTGWRDNEHLQQIWKQRNLKQKNKLAALLRGYYDARDANPLLKMRDIGIFGAVRLEPAIDRTKLTSTNLKIYQNEMTDFGTYLLNHAEKNDPHVSQPQASGLD
jgi:hypothetical protein